MQKYSSPIGIVNGIKVYEYQKSHVKGVKSFAVIEMPDGDIKKVLLLEDRIPDRWYFKIGNYRYPLTSMSLSE